MEDFKMKIILYEDVKALGKKGEVVDVKDGYARNYIIPNNLGVEATKQNLNKLKKQRAADKREQDELLEEAQEFGKKLEDITVNMELKIGEGGRAFGSITTMEIANSVEEQFGFKLDRKKVQLDEPIKAAGDYNVSVRLHPEVTIQIKVKVKAV